MEAVRCLRTLYTTVLEVYLSLYWPRVGQAPRAGVSEGVFCGFSAHEGLSAPMEAWQCLHHSLHSSVGQ